jgi:hypothetical protein
MASVLLTRFMSGVNTMRSVRFNGSSTRRHHETDGSIARTTDDEVRGALFAATGAPTDTGSSSGDTGYFGTNATAIKPNSKSPKPTPTSKRRALSTSIWCPEKGCFKFRALFILRSGPFFKQKSNDFNGPERI